MKLDGLWRRTSVALRSLTTRAHVRVVARAKLPTKYGEFEIHVYETRLKRQTDVALVRGNIGDGEGVLVRVHSSCLAGDVFHSARCDCDQLIERVLQPIASDGRGILLYVSQEGRGIGLTNKIRAYALQEQGYDTVEANERLGFGADLRDYGLAVAILQHLGVQSINLLSNNPRKLAGVTTHGLRVMELLPHEISA